MTRDGTVGRSDATERSLPFHRDIDPVRMVHEAAKVQSTALFALPEIGDDLKVRFCIVRKLRHEHIGADSLPHRH
jgi:hypothetical protein